MRFPAAFWLIMRVLYGARRPEIPVPGTELAGVVKAVGKDVRRFAEGDQVFGSTGMRFGANAEYVCMSEDGVVVRKPTNVTFEEATAVPFGALTALHFLRKGNIRRGQKVLINGASGGVGTAAVQVAKHYGADVTGVCSTANLELVRSLGADACVDYTSEDFAERGERYDLIFDAVAKRSPSECKNALAPEGTFVTTKAGLAKETTEDLIFLKALVEAGELRAVIDRRYPLDRIVDAHRYVEQGHKKGNVVVTVAQGHDRG
jgi:NADPH:quinone reductase-like Zn-dependent oxidoreductase